MNPAQFMMQREAQNYQSRLSQWETQVRATQDLTRALQLASQKPTLSGMGTPLKGTMSGQMQRAQAAVERHLEDKLNHVSRDDPQFALYMRLTQGHWPRLWQKLNRLPAK